MGFNKNNWFFFFLVFISAVLVKEATCTSRKALRPLHVTKRTALFHARVPQHVTTVCEKTDYSTLCVRSVSPVLHGPADPMHLLAAEIEATILRFKLAMTKLKMLEANPRIPKMTLSAYEICKQQYVSAIDSLHTAKSAMSSRDMGTINSELSAVVTDAGTCDDTFAENPDSVSQLTGTDTELSHLGSNCLAISELIKW